MKMSLKALRVNKNLLQSELASLVGVSVATIKNWESGRSYPDQPKIDKLCRIFGVPYDAINFLPED